MTTGQGLLGNNMFAYCLNDPVNFADPSGRCSYKPNLGGWLDCGMPNCEQSQAYVELDDLGIKLTLFAFEVVEAAVNSIEASVGTGMGLGGSVGVTAYGVPAEISAYNRTASMLTLSNGEFDIISKTGYGYGTSVLKYLGKNTENGWSHSITGENCHCKWWETAYCDMAACKANEKFTDTSTAIGVSFGLYLLIGVEASIGFNPNTFCNNVNDAWKSIFQ